MKIRKFFVTIEWDYTIQLESCIIQPYLPEFEPYDGYNVVGGCGRDGISCQAYDDLATAIVNANFNPKHIKFIKLTFKEKIFVNKLIKFFKKGA